MMNILYQFNEKYAPYAGVSITSLFENNKGDSLCVYILGEDLSEESSSRFDKLASKYGQQITILKTSELIERMKEWGLPSYRGSYAANLRMFIPYYLSDDVDRILYLDADTVVNGSIKELYDTNLQDNVVAMIADSLGGYYKKLRLNYAADDMYFNSGVILFDLNRWRRDDYSKKIIDHVNSNEWNYSSPDQDLINIVCKGRIKAVSPKFNFQPVHYVFGNKEYFICYGHEGYYDGDTIDSARDDVRIYHFFRFLGEFPWDRGSKHPYAKIFDRYLKDSLWNDLESSVAEISPAMKIERLLYAVLPKPLFLRVFVIGHNRYLNTAAETD